MLLYSGNLGIFIDVSLKITEDIPVTMYIIYCSEKKISIKNYKLIIKN